MIAAGARALFTLWLAATLVFFALRVLPGDAIEGQLLGTGADAEAVEARRAALGLNLPITTQYAVYLGSLLRGDLGVSLTNGLPVSEIIARQIPPTLMLGFSALMVSVVLGLALALISALDIPRGVHRVVNALIALALSVPIYWSGMIAIYIFAAQLNWLPSGGGERLSQIVLPAMVLGFHISGSIAQVLETDLRVVIRANYVMTGRAKGLSETTILARHILPNAIIPSIAVIALQGGFLLGGVVITESLFSRPGLGRELLNATLQQNYPLVQGIVLWMTGVYILFNTAGDLLSRWIDPRLRDAAP